MLKRVALDDVRGVRSNTEKVRVRNDTKGLVVLDDASLSFQFEGF